MKVQCKNLHIKWTLSCLDGLASKHNNLITSDSIGIVTRYLTSCCQLRGLSSILILLQVDYNKIFLIFLIFSTNKTRVKRHSYKPTRLFYSHIPPADELVDIKINFFSLCLLSDILTGGHYKITFQTETPLQSVSQRFQVSTKC